MNTDEYKLRFEEYKMFRDTIIHFDKILINLRKNAISFAFTIFGAAIAVITVNIPDGLKSKFTVIDLAIVLILIELIMTLSFLYLDWHYRYYLLKIAESAIKYEEKLELGVKLIECDYQKEKNIPCDMTASISKCLNCLHDKGMENHIRAAHFNIYALLLALGYIVLNILLFLKINLSLNEVILPLIIIVAITFGSAYLYVHINIKKQKEFHNNSLFYIISIFLFTLLTYSFYYFIPNNIVISKFTISVFEALLISFVIFVALVFRKK